MVIPMQAVYVDIHIHTSYNPNKANEKYDTKHRQSKESIHHSIYIKNKPLTADQAARGFLHTLLLFYESLSRSILFLYSSSTVRKNCFMLSQSVSPGTSQPEEITKLSKPMQLCIRAWVARRIFQGPLLLLNTRDGLMLPMTMQFLGRDSRS